MRALLWAASAAILLSACTTTPPPPSPSATGPTPIFGFMREFSAPGDFLGPTPTAVVLFNPGEAGRNQIFCEAYLKLPPAGHTGFVHHAIAIRWPLTVDMLTPEQRADCAFLLTRYDFERAAEIRASLLEAQVPAASLEGRGPFIVEFLPSGGVVAVNASSLSSTDLLGFASMLPATLGKATSAASTGASETPPSCAIDSPAANQCTLERVIVESVAQEVIKAWPALAVGWALGERIVCAITPANFRSKWCGLPS